MSNDDNSLRTDVYQDNSEPDVPQTSLARMDSAVDVMIAAAQLAADTDVV